MDGTLFLLILLSGLISAEVELCHQNPCLNGGICYKVPGTLENTFCDKTFTAYRHTCYKLITNAQTWAQANRFCNSIQANLLTIDSEWKRNFVSVFMKQYVSPYGPFTAAPSTPNTWTSGRFQSTNVTQKGFYWNNLEGKSPLNSVFWASGQPGYALSTSSCIVVTGQTEFRDWAVKDCNKDKSLFICEKPEKSVAISVVYSDVNSSYYYQCRCERGYTGLNCEIQPDPKQPAQSSQMVVCNNEPFTFACPTQNDEVVNIVVDYAAFGRMPGQNLPRSCATPNLEENCVADNTLPLFMQRCQNVNSCSLERLATVFTTNPCLPGNANFLEYRFRCVKEAAECAPGTDFRLNKCYEFVHTDIAEERKSWADAQHYCKGKGGDIVGPIDAELHKHFADKLVAGTDNKNRYFWIGLKSLPQSNSTNEKLVEGVWTNGQPLSFRSAPAPVFRPEGSYAHDGACMAYYVQPARPNIPMRYVWVAKNCNQKFDWICEYPATGVQPRPKLNDPTWTPLTATSQTTTVWNETPGQRPGTTTDVTTENLSTAEIIEKMSETTPNNLVDLTTTTIISPDSSVFTTSLQLISTDATSTEMVFATELATSTKDNSTADLLSTGSASGFNLFEFLTTVQTSQFEHSTPASDNVTEWTNSSESITNATDILNATTTNSTDNFGTNETVNIWDFTKASPVITAETQTAISQAALQLTTESAVTTSELSSASTAEEHSINETTTESLKFEATEGTEIVFEYDSIKIPETSEPTSTQLTLLTSQKSDESDSSTTSLPNEVAIPPWEMTPAKPNMTSVEVTTATTTTLTTPAVETTVRPVTTVKTTIVATTATRPTTKAIPTGPNFCEPQYYRNVYWPRTREGLTAVMSCPINTTGVATWKCMKSTKGAKFTPEFPDLAGCKHAWVNDADVQIGQKQPAVKIVNFVNEKLMSSEHLYGGDLTSLIDTVSQLISLQNDQLKLQSRSSNPFQRSNEALNFTKSIGFNSDQLLDAKVLRAWNDLPATERSQKASRYMMNLEYSAALLTRYVPTADSEKEFRFNNLDFKVQVNRLKQETEGNVGFASNISYVNPFAYGTSKSFITLPEQGIFGKVVPSMDAPNAPLYDDQPISVGVGYYLYKQNLQAVLSGLANNTIVNSEIVGATVNNPNETIKFPTGQPVTLKLFHLRTTDVHNARCSFWNTTVHNWDQSGCTLVETNDMFTVCSCNHLTSFAVLMDVSGNLEALPEIHQDVLKWLTRVGCGISIICLIASILVFTVFRSLWSDRNTIHRNLCLCLCVGELLFLFGIDQTEYKGVCTGVAIVLHYMFLSAFLWMLIEGYQLYVMLVKVFDHEKSRVVYYYLVAYGVPILPVAITAGLRLPDYGTDTYCWINVKSDAIWAFVAPISLVIFLNILFLGVALKVVFSVGNFHDRSTLAKFRGWVKGSTLLLCLLGITWVFGYLLVIAPATLVFAYVFTILNSLQGVFIFVFHVVMNDKVHTALTKCCRRTCQCCLGDKYDSVNSSSMSGSDQSKPYHSNATVSSSLPMKQSLNGPQLNIIPSGYVHGHLADVKRRRFDGEIPVGGDVILANGYEHNADVQSKPIATLSYTNDAFDEEQLDLMRTSKLSAANLLPLTTVSPTHLCSKDCRDAKSHFDGFHDVNGELVARRRSRPSIDSTTNVESKQQFVDHF